MNSLKNIYSHEAAYTCANAYIASAYNSLTEADMIAIRTLSHDLNNIPLLKHYLDLAPFAKVHELFVHTIEKSYKIPSSCMVCIKLLHSLQLLSLLPLILEWIIKLYFKRKGYALVTVETAQEIEENQKKLITLLARNKIGPVIIEKYSINPSLIAGIRIYSEGLLWEDSLASRLKMIQKVCTS